MAALKTENPMGRLKKPSQSTASASSDMQPLSQADIALLDQRMAKAPDLIKEELQNKIRRANNNPLESKRYKAQLAYVESKMPSGIPNDDPDWQE